MNTKKFFFFNRVQFRVNVGLALILGLSFAGLSWFLLSTQWRLLVDDLARRGQQQAQAAAEAGAVHIERGSLFLLEELVAKVEYSPRVAFCRIVDASGRDLVPDRRRVVHDPGNELVVSWPIEAEDRNLGEVRVGMRLDDVRQEIRTTTVRMVAAFLSVLGLVCVLAHLFLRRVLIAPVQTLVRMARDVGGREFVSTRLAERRDEIGQLAGEFNAMSANLREAYQGLERTVTERTEKLHVALREVQAIFDNSLVGIAVMDGEGGIQRFNKRFAEMFGHDSAALSHMSMVDLHFSRKSHAEFLHRYHAAIGQHGMMQHDHQFIRANGTRFWCQVSAKPIDPREASKGVIWVFEDITERMRASEVLRAQADDLRRAKDDADRATTAKSEFVARMSHEIRTPMNAILGMAQMLSETNLDTEQSEYVRTFSSAGEMLLTIINDILDFSKIEEGRMELESIPFDLARVAEETTRLLKTQAAVKGLELQLGISGDVGACYEGDPTRLRQILVNLIGNAIKFTPRGHVRLDVDLLAPDIQDTDGPGERQWCRFRVRDTGVGIPEDKLEHVFESFSQADSSTTRAFGGTGLGLAISRRLVELMGGTIRAESAVGQGTEFCVLLPLTALGPEALVHDDAGLDRIEIPQRRSDAPPRVLVVDDVEANRRVVELFLRGQDIDLTLAKDGSEGLRLVQDQPYDLILMDMEMPVMDGMAATRAIRAWEREQGFEPAHIVAMTAHSFVEQKEAIMAAGCSGYLAKPIRKSGLLRVLDDYRAGVGPRDDEVVAA
ncbi:MAG: response regulator [Deltaproteobacteria bacterium]|nr:response regulator [Deltaproteobacteria bacterium]